MVDKDRMKKEQLKHFKQILLDKKAEIVSSVDKEETEGREAVSQGGKDPYDAATESYDQEFWFSISEAGRKTLEQIDEALRKIEEGTFGVCEGCSKPIDMPRLEVVPQAPLCISCQEQEERNTAAIFFLPS